MLAAAYVRGAQMRTGGLLPSTLTEPPLGLLTEAEVEQIFAAGAAAGLKLYHFKEKEDLPRVRAVLGFLKGVQPSSLLDVGSGRGVFLFPFLRDFPDLPVTALDLLPHRVAMLEDLARGGTGAGGLPDAGEADAALCRRSAPRPLAVRLSKILAM